jgi:hypothetical protein
MSHTYVQNLLHVVFSTKERRKLIPTSLNHVYGAILRESASGRRYSSTRSAGSTITSTC